MEAFVTPRAAAVGGPRQHRPPPAEALVEAVRLWEQRADGTAERQAMWV
jgi:hypothetical protein